MNVFFRNALLLSLCFFTLITTAIADDFSTDVVGISEVHLSADFWVNKLNQPAKLSKSSKGSISHQNNSAPSLMTTAQIKAFNQQLIDDNPYISSPFSIADFLTASELHAKINEISTIPSAPRFYGTGKQVSEDDYDGYISATNKENVQQRNKVLLGLVVKRTGLRRFPTNDKVYKEILSLDEQVSADVNVQNIKNLNTSLDKIFNKNRAINLEKDLDMFQESALFPGDAVAVIHTSKDGLWYLVQAYNYLAWLAKEDVAIGSKTEILAFKEASDFLVVTGSKVFTQYIPNYDTDNASSNVSSNVPSNASTSVNNTTPSSEHLPNSHPLNSHPLSSHPLSNIQLDMGVRLPLAKRSDYENNLYGQNPYASYIVKFPVKNSEGKLHITLVAIARSQDVNVGYLTLTSAQLIKQSFKFLGERYGWGHDYNGRDCTGFVDEVYKSFGFIMPRNSSQQAKGNYGQNHFFNEKATTAEKLAVIATLQVGDLIYIPGHVMMYIGHDQGKPYIIHDVKELAYTNKAGIIYHGTLNGVSVTPLLPLQDYVNNITNIKRLSNAQH